MFKFKSKQEPTPPMPAANAGGNGQAIAGRFKKLIALFGDDIRAAGGAKKWFSTNFGLSIPQFVVCHEAVARQNWRQNIENFFAHMDAGKQLGVNMDKDFILKILMDSKVKDIDTFSKHEALEAFQGMCRGTKLSTRQIGIIRHIMPY